MKSHELANRLRELPDREVLIFWDGFEGGDVDGIILGESKIVIIGDWGCYRSGLHRMYQENEIVYDVNAEEGD